MNKSFTFLLKIILITVAYFPVPIVIGELYFKRNSESGPITIFSNEIQIIEWLLLAFYGVLLLYLAVRLYIFYKKSLMVIGNKYLYSSIYVLVLFLTFCCLKIFYL
jgi:hypothetical protein